jgi:hypothetical protein
LTALALKYEVLLSTPLTNFKEDKAVDEIGVAGDL